MLVKNYKITLISIPSHHGYTGNEKAQIDKKRIHWFSMNKTYAYSLLKVNKEGCIQLAIEWNNSEIKS